MMDHRENDYHYKYQKYKTKYLKLKEEVGGAEKKSSKIFPKKIHVLDIIEDNNREKQIIVFAYGCRIPWGEPNVFTRSVFDEKTNTWSEVPITNKDKEAYEEI